MKSNSRRRRGRGRRRHPGMDFEREQCQMLPRLKTRTAERALNLAAEAVRVVSREWWAGARLWG